MAEAQNVFSEIYQYIEETSADFIDKVVKDEVFLKGVGKLWEGYLDYRTVIDKMVTDALKNLNVANKKDQEKILFRLNQLESKVQQISRTLEKIK
jgi:hypothetical protein